MPKRRVEEAGMLEKDAGRLAGAWSYPHKLIHPSMYSTIAPYAFWFSMFVGSQVFSEWEMMLWQSLKLWCIAKSSSLMAKGVEFHAAQW